MPHEFTNDGRQWDAKRRASVGTRLDAIEVGVGTADPDPEDDSLSEFVHRGDITDKYVGFEDSSLSPWHIDAIITVFGDTEVPAGAPISELGIWIDGVPDPATDQVPADQLNTLYYRATFPPVRVDKGHPLPLAVNIGSPPDGWSVTSQDYVSMAERLNQESPALANVDEPVTVAGVDPLATELLRETGRESLGGDSDTAVRTQETADE